jgi:REP element-mobilizing transposase RayT
MGRALRPHLPGATFHLTARLHHREALFEDDLKTAVVGYMRENFATYNVEVFAYAVMANHLHIVVRQSDQPLGQFMQPLLRRMALLVQRHCKRSGYVFEQRYRHRICADGDYLRNTIVYTHLNPVRAGLCERPEDYLWSSHSTWIGQCSAADRRIDLVNVERVLPLFAAAADRTYEQLIDDYKSFVEWRVAVDRWHAQFVSTGSAGCSPSPPAVAQGDCYWKRHLMPAGDAFPGPLVSGEPIVAAMNPARPDLATIGRSVVAAAPVPLDLSMVRSRWGGPPYVGARRAIVRRAFAYGYRSAQIATYLRVSASMVANVLAEERKRLLLANQTNRSASRASDLRIAS